jgi:hypothetical protein
MAGRREANKLALACFVDGTTLGKFLKWPRDKQEAYAAGKAALGAEGLAAALRFLDNAAAKRKVPKGPSLRWIEAIPLFAKDDDPRFKKIASLKDIANDYQVPFKPLRQALTILYRKHRKQFADRWSRQKKLGSKDWQRATAKFNTTTKIPVFVPGAPRNPP